MQAPQTKSDGYITLLAWHSIRECVLSGSWNSILRFELSNTPCLGVVNLFDVSLNLSLELSDSVPSEGVPSGSTYRRGAGPGRRTASIMSNFPPPNSGQWTTGLCGCFEDCGTCLCGYFCPCVIIGRYIEIIDQGATSCCEGGTIWLILQLLTGCACLYTCGYRGRLRQKFGLPASPCGDFCTEWCCYGCSVCQVYRELRNRNINPELGWAGAQKVWDQPPQAAVMRM